MLQAPGIYLTYSGIPVTISGRDDQGRWIGLMVNDSFHVQSLWTDDGFTTCEHQPWNIVFHTNAVVPLDRVVRFCDWIDRCLRNDLNFNGVDLHALRDYMEPIKQHLQALPPYVALYEGWFHTVGGINVYITGRTPSGKLWHGIVYGEHTQGDNLWTDTGDDYEGYRSWKIAGSGKHR